MFYINKSDLKRYFPSLRVTKKSIVFIYQKNDFIVIANESSSEAIFCFLCQNIYVFTIFNFTLRIVHCTFLIAACRAMYLDYAESQAQKGIVMFMKDWVKKLDAFLQFNEEAILKHQGKVSHDVAIALAESEYDKFRIIQDKLIESDFDKELKKLKK